MKTWHCVVWQVFTDIYLGSGGAYCLHLQDYALKMEETGYSETLVNIYQTTRLHISEDSLVNSYNSRYNFEKLKG
jgi:hypothetical protein